MHASYLGNDAHFPLDGRGRWEQGWILNEEDLKRKFTHQLQLMVSKDDLCVESATKWVNEVLLKDEGDALKKHGLKLPISQTTVHQWMH